MGVGNEAVWMPGENLEHWHVHQVLWVLVWDAKKEPRALV